MNMACILVGHGDEGEFKDRVDPVALYETRSHEWG